MEYVSALGTDIPALGLGTWLMEGEECARVVDAAIGLGYRHIDTAQGYGNEAEVGRALAATAVDREDLWVTTKIDNHNHAGEAVINSTESSLHKLRTGYVDLLLIHWPVEFERLPETLDAMMQLVARGLVAHVGVSNFSVEQFDRAADIAPVITNQVEYHPLRSQAPVLEAARARNAVVTAYSPLARGAVLDIDLLQEIGSARGWTAAQVALRWLLDQDDVAAIPKAADEAHLADNFAVLGESLSDEERAAVDGLASDARVT